MKSYTLSLVFIAALGLGLPQCVEEDSPDPPVEEPTPNNAPNNTPNNTDNESEGDCVSDEDCREKFADETRIENMDNFTCRVDDQGVTFCSECESSDECASGVCTSIRFCKG